MKSFTMVLLATAALALPAVAAQQYSKGQQGQQHQQQGRSVQDQTWSGREGGQGQSRIRAQNLSSEQIRKIQRALHDAGFRASKVDGEWGPNTREALKNFQQEKGMAATGQLNRRSLSALGLNPQRFATGESRGTTGRSVSPRSGRSMQGGARYQTPRGGRYYDSQGGRYGAPQQR
jgi:peptidoglycan hydrolase-like protein with peptidoglycan-binding domain